MVVTHGMDSLKRLASQYVEMKSVESDLASRTDLFRWPEETRLNRSVKTEAVKLAASDLRPNKDMPCIHISAR